jgi:hypothetical protein
MASNIWEQRAVAGVASNTADLAEMSQYVVQIVVLTQTAYDALPASKLTDSKLYVIVGA